MAWLFFFFPFHIQLLQFYTSLSPLWLAIVQRICVLLCSDSWFGFLLSSPPPFFSHDARGVNEGGNELLECSCVFVHSFVRACGAVYRALLFRKREHSLCVPADMRVTDLIFPLVRSFCCPHLMTLFDCMRSIQVRLFPQDVKWDYWMEKVARGNIFLDFSKQ